MLTVRRRGSEAHCALQRRVGESVCIEIIERLTLAALRQERGVRRRHDGAEAEQLDMQRRQSPGFRSDEGIELLTASVVEGMGALAFLLFASAVAYEVMLVGYCRVGEDHEVSENAEKGCESAVLHTPANINILRFLRKSA